MTIEVAVFIDDLDAAFPEFDTGVVDGDDHLRLLKFVLQSTFPSMAAAVTASNVELNRLDGILLDTAVDLSDNGNTFNMGVLAGAHMAFSAAILQAKASATTAAGLAINRFGGDVNIGAQSGTGGVNLWDDTVLRLAVNTVGALITGTGLILDNSGFATRSDISNRNSNGGVALEVIASNGNINIRQLAAGGGDEILWMTLIRDAEVRLAFNNVQKFATAAGGVDITGILEASGDVTIGGTSVVQETRQVLGGAGLTAGGDLSSDVTLNIANATNGGLGINANDMQVNLANLLAATPVLADEFAFNDSGTTRKATLAVLNALLIHDDLAGFVSGEHILHSGVDIIAGTGLTGGGTIDATRTINAIGGVAITAAADALNFDFSGLTNRSIADLQPTDSLCINNGGVMEQIDIQDMGLRVVNTSSAQTFALGDVNTFQVLTGATPRDWVIPPNSSVAIGIGQVIYGGARDTASLGIDPGAGVTLTSNKASGTATQDIKAGGTFAIIKVLTDEWMLVGDLV